MTDQKWCFWVDETCQTPNGFVPAVVTEDEPGFAPLIGNGEFARPWYWGDTIDRARELVEHANAEIGVSPERADEILLSSMRASFRAQAASERWQRIKEGRE